MGTYNQEMPRLMKELPRSMVWNMVKEPAKRVLLFPGKHCHDLVLGLSQGKINERTEFVLVERDPKVARSIRKKCKSLGLHSFEIVNQVFDGKVLKNQGHFDLAFFDFCGEMTEVVFDALGEPGWSAENIAMTFSTKYRFNNFQRKFPGYRNSFNPPSDAMVLANHKKENEHAYWTCDAALIGLHKDSKSLIHFIGYKEGKKGCPMVFFTLDTGQKSIAKKASISRQLNLLQRKYDNTLSAGVKAGFKRKMNMLKKNT